MLFHFGLQQDSVRGSLASGVLWVTLLFAAVMLTFGGRTVLLWVLAVHCLCPWSGITGPLSPILPGQVQKFDKAAATAWEGSDPVAEMPVN